MIPPDFQPAWSKLRHMEIQIKKDISHFSVVLLPVLPERLHEERGGLASSLAS